jgi:hypothetical protein
VYAVTLTNPENGIEVMISLYFSSAPGCWERHLQRKTNNPLFLNCDTPTQNEVNDAQRQDETERMTFMQMFQTLLEETVALKPQEETEVILSLKQRTDALYEECACLGGDFQAQKEALKKLNALIMNAIQKEATDNDKLVEELDNEVLARQLHFALLEHPVIAHLLRPETPINEMDIIPTLLTENETAVQAAMGMFDREHQQLLCNKARILLETVQQQGLNLPDAEIRLAIMEQSFNSMN